MCELLTFVKKRYALIATGLAILLIAVMFGFLFGQEVIIGHNDFREAPANAMPAIGDIGTENFTQERKIVVIDPGHGADDPGCIHNSIRESDLNLAMAFRVRDYLESLGYDIILTREDDSDVSLKSRAAIAQNVNADVFISIHHNAYEYDSSVEGLETWYNDQMNELNAGLAASIQGETALAANAKDRGLWISRKFILLSEHTLTMPACLVEAGFLSSTKERERLLSPDYQDKIAQGIVNGIVKFFGSE